MDNSLKLVATKEVVEGILAKHTGKDFVRCLNCGSIMSDAVELANTLYGISQEALDSEKEGLVEISESCSDLLGEIMTTDKFVADMPEDYDINTDFCVNRLNENDEMSLPELSEFEYVVYAIRQEVLLKVNDSCGCFE